MTPRIATPIRSSVVAHIVAGLAIFIATYQSEATTTSFAADLTGRASVIDGDTIEIHGQRIRLFGIDAPEGGQLCDDAQGKAYRCGQAAALALADKIGSATVQCEPRDTDRYKRAVAICRAGELELNRWLVSEGLAIEYQKYSGGRYRDAEDDAKAAKRGLWAGTFEWPWEWRRR